MVWAILALVLVVAGAWPLARLSLYRRSVPYDPTRSYEYGFGAVEQHDVPFDGHSLALPKVPEDCAALLLKLDLDKALLGSFFDPCVHVRFRSRQAENWFERGASGARYLNLSHLHKLLQFEAGRAEVALRHVRARPQMAKLFVFKKKLRRDERLAVVAPHPDDAEIAAYGLYRTHHRTAWLVAVTPGDASLRYRAMTGSDAEASQLSANLRASDSAACAALAGIKPERVIGLGYFDSMLAAMHTASPAPVESRYGTATKRDLDLRDGWAASWPNLVSDLRRILQANGISAIACPHPLMDSHPDHVLTTLAVCEAVLAEPALSVKLLLYVNHHVSTEAYPFGPSGSAVTVPPSSQTASSVFSHQLDRAAQIEKACALDINHALRDLPSPWLGPMAIKALVDWLRRILLGSHLYDFSYYRRAVRQNEIFFVVSDLEIEKLRDAIVVRLGAA